MKSEFENLSITVFVESLRHIMPPQTVIHIGAGAGQGAMHSWKNWDVLRALMIDADEARLTWANDLVDHHSEWKVISAVIAEQNFETDYYLASNPNEDGVISPAKLSSFWSNLQTKEQIRVQTQSLDSLIETTAFSLSNATVTWLIIDCLSALDILKGAKQTLGVASVLWLRVLLQPMSSCDLATIKDVTIFLQSLGYRCVNVVESNHPAIGEAFFVRDWHTVWQQNATVIAEVELSRIQSETVIAKLQYDNANVMGDKLALEQLLAEQDVQRTTLQQEKYALETQAQSLQVELLASGNEREAQRQHFESEIASLKNEIERLSHDCLVFSTDKAALENLLEQQSEQHRLLQNENASVVANQSALEQLLAEQDAQRTLLQQEKSSLEQQRQSLENELLVLSNEREEQFQHSESEITQLKNELERVSHDCLVFSTDKAALENLLAQQSEQHRSLQNEILSLAQMRDEQTHLANERQQQLESSAQNNQQWQQEKSAFETQIQVLQSEIAQVTTARDEQVQIVMQNKIVIDDLRNTLQQNESRMAQLETHLTESDARQKMLNEEVIKAEAQIELIKDVLLRESEV